MLKIPVSHQRTEREAQECSYCRMTPVRSSSISVRRFGDIVLGGQLGGWLQPKTGHERLAFSVPMTSPRRLCRAGRAGSETLMFVGLHGRIRLINPYDLAWPGVTDTIRSIGTWRSLVARSVRDAEVAGSNPAVPTQKPGRGRSRSGLLPFLDQCNRSAVPLVWGANTTR